MCICLFNYIKETIKINTSLFLILNHLYMIVFPLTESAEDRDMINSDSSQVLKQSHCIFQSHSCYKNEGIFCRWSYCKVIIGNLNFNCIYK